MANPEHLAKLNTGVEAWNQWRLSNPSIKPDLPKADLTGADLSHADLLWADREGVPPARWREMQRASPVS